MTDQQQNEKPSEWRPHKLNMLDGSERFSDKSFSRDAGPLVLTVTDQQEWGNAWCAHVTVKEPHDQDGGTLYSKGGFESRETAQKAAEAHAIEFAKRIQIAIGHGLLNALAGFGEDFMTSEQHHPGYVLIPSAQFERVRSAVSEATHV
jgi:hypothetical protein